MDTHAGDWKKRLQTMFDRFDLDNSGTISPSEMRRGLSSDPMNLDFTDLEFAKVMRVIDPDQGGDVSLEEMQRCIDGADFSMEKSPATPSATTPSAETPLPAEEGSFL